MFGLRCEDKKGLHLLIFRESFKVQKCLKVRQKQTKKEELFYSGGGGGGKKLGRGGCGSRPEFQ